MNRKKEKERERRRIIESSVCLVDLSVFFRVLSTSLNEQTILILVSFEHFNDIRSYVIARLKELLLLFILTRLKQSKKIDISNLIILKSMRLTDPVERTSFQSDENTTKDRGQIILKVKSVSG